MEIETVNVRMPREITDWLDVLVKKGVYHSRAEAIREFIRAFISENRN